MRRARLHRELDAAGRALPAVHGPLHAQRPVQGQPQARGMGRVRPEGRVRHGKPAGRVGEGRTGRPTEMESKGLKAAASRLREGISETTTYLLDDYPVEHRRRIRTNNMIERPDREIRRRTRVVGSFPDGRSALMLVCARIRYVTANQWSARRYLDMSRLDGIMQSTD